MHHRDVLDNISKSLSWTPHHGGNFNSGVFMLNSLYLSQCHSICSTVRTEKQPNRDTVAKDRWFWPEHTEIACAIDLHTVLVPRRNCYYENGPTTDRRGTAGRPKNVFFEA